MLRTWLRAWSLLLTGLGKAGVVSAGGAGQRARVLSRGAFSPIGRLGRGRSSWRRAQKEGCYVNGISGRAGNIGKQDGRPTQGPGLDCDLEAVVLELGLRIKLGAAGVLLGHSAALGKPSSNEVEVRIRRTKKASWLARPGPWLCAQECRPADGEEDVLGVVLGWQIGPNRKSQQVRCQKPDWPPKDGRKTWCSVSCRPGKVPLCKRQRFRFLACLQASRLRSPPSNSRRVRWELRRDAMLMNSATRRLGAETASPRLSSQTARPTATYRSRVLDAG